MDVWKHLRDVLPNVEWDLVKWIIRQVAWATVFTAITAGARKVKDRVSDWWVLGTVFVVSLFILYMTSDSQRSMTTPVVVPSPTSSTVVSSPAHSAPPGFTDTQIQQLKFTFLGLPRPCSVQVTAVAENVALRQAFLTVLKDNHVNSSREGNRTLIEECQLKEDEKDQHPELYEKELSGIPKGVIVVSGVGDEGVDQDMKHVVDVLREMNLKVRTGMNTSSGAVGTRIHIQIGAGLLQR